MRLQPRCFFLFILVLLAVSLVLFYLINRQLGERRYSKPELVQQPQVSIQAEFDTVVRRAKKKLINANVSHFGSVCHLPACVKMYESLVYNKSAQRIPPLRHILWKNDRVSSYMARQLRTWSTVHPKWNYVLWRDSDLEKFVAKHYTGVLGKFKSLGMHIMKIDMIRHMILHHFGGVYADLDYVLVRPLDRFLKFPAVVTRETEAHAFFHFGMGTYPPSVLANPAFMMSEPGHPFYLFAIMQLNCRGAGHFNQFAGPPALSDLLNQYAREFPLSENPDGVVIVPASRNFYGFDNNNFASSTSTYKGSITGRLNGLCNEIKKNANIAKDLVAYCKDVNNLDPITDKNELAYAIHDYNKSRSSYDPAGSAAFDQNQVDIRGIFPHLLMADSIF